MNKAVMITVVFLVLLSSLVLAQDDSSDCNWLCQILNWFTGEGKVK